MEQVEQLCDDICLISNGEIVVQGDLREIKRKAGKNTVMLDFEGSDAFLDTLEENGSVRLNTRSTRHAEIRLLGATRPRQVLDAALDCVEDISRFELVEPSMREIFVSAVLTQQGKNPEAAEAAEVAL